MSLNWNQKLTFSAFLIDQWKKNPRDWIYLPPQCVLFLSCRCAFVWASGLGVFLLSSHMLFKGKAEKKVRRKLVEVWRKSNKSVGLTQKCCWDRWRPSLHGRSRRAARLYGGEGARAASFLLLSSCPPVYAWETSPWDRPGGYVCGQVDRPSPELGRMYQTDFSCPSKMNWI